MRNDGGTETVKHTFKQAHLTDVHSIYLSLHMLWKVFCECVSVLLILALLSVQPLYDHKISGYIHTIGSTEISDSIK